jgi:hypothetical protein
MHQSIDHVFQFLQAAGSSIVCGVGLRNLLSNDIAVLAIGRAFRASTTWLSSITFQFLVAAG